MSVTTHYPQVQAVADPLRVTELWELDETETAGKRDGVVRDTYVTRNRREEMVLVFRKRFNSGNGGDNASAQQQALDAQTDLFSAESEETHESETAVDGADGDELDADVAPRDNTGAQVHTNGVQNVRKEGGRLVLQAKKQASSTGASRLTGARVYSDFALGNAMRIVLTGVRMPRFNGAWAGISLQPAAVDAANDHCGGGRGLELDIVERAVVECFDCDLSQAGAGGASNMPRSPPPACSRSVTRLHAVAEDEHATLSTSAGYDHGHSHRTRRLRGAGSSASRHNHRLLHADDDGDDAYDHMHYLSARLFDSGRSGGEAMCGAPASGADADPFANSIAVPVDITVDVRADGAVHLFVDNPFDSVTGPAYIGGIHADGTFFLAPSSDEDDGDGGYDLDGDGVNSDAFTGTGARIAVQTSGKNDVCPTQLTPFDAVLNQIAGKPLHLAFNVGIGGALVGALNAAGANLFEQQKAARVQATTGSGSTERGEYGNTFADLIDIDVPGAAASEAANAQLSVESVMIYAFPGESANPVQRVAGGAWVDVPMVAGLPQNGNDSPLS